jgi:hypothetical protein
MGATIAFCLALACQQAPPAEAPLPLHTERAPAPEPAPSVPVVPTAPTRPDDEIGQLAILASEVVLGDANSLVTIVQAGSYEPGAGLDTPDFRAWLTQTYQGQVRLAIVRDKKRETVWFERYGALKFVNGVIDRVVSFNNKESRERYYVGIVQTELVAQAASRTSYADRVKKNLVQTTVATGELEHPVVSRETVWRADLDGAVVEGPQDALVTALLGCSPASPSCAWFYAELRKIANVRALRIALRFNAENLVCEDEFTALAQSARGAAFFRVWEDLNELQPKIQYNSISTDYLLPWNRAVLAKKAPLCGPKELSSVGMKYRIPLSTVKQKIDPARKTLRENRGKARRIEGAQALFINGRRLDFHGYGVPAPELSTEQVTELIVQTVEEEETRAKQLVLQGVSVQNLYESLTREGVTIGQ